MSDIAVSIHDVEPATFDRCALIRDWLDDHGIDKATLLVIPARDMHPFQDRRPELAEWLAERVQLGDCVAQHGFQHRTGRAEFAGLDDAETKRVVDAGHRLLHLAGVEPRGFVAPAFAYTDALRRVLAARYDWWASLSRLWRDHGRQSLFAPALTFGSPLLVRAGGLLAGPLLRLDLHPTDLDHPARIGAIESVLKRAQRRTPVTYDEVAAV